MPDFFSFTPSTPFDAALQLCETLSENLDKINELADILISQNVWLTKRVRELEERLYKLEAGGVNSGILRQQQGGQFGGRPSSYNSLFSPALMSLFANPNMNNHISEVRQQQMPLPIPPLTSFNFLTLGQRGKVESTTIEQH